MKKKLRGKTLDLTKLGIIKKRKIENTDATEKNTQ